MSYSCISVAATGGKGTGGHKKVVVHYSTVILGVVGGFIITIVGLAICITCRVRHKEEQRRLHAMKQEERHSANAIEMTTLLNPTPGNPGPGAQAQANTDLKFTPEMNHVTAQRLANHVREPTQPNGDPHAAHAHGHTGNRTPVTPTASYKKYPDVSNFSEDDTSPVSSPTERIQVTMERHRSPKPPPQTDRSRHRDDHSPRPDIIHGEKFDRPQVLRQRSYDVPRERYDRSPTRRYVDDMDTRYPKLAENRFATVRNPREAYYPEQLGTSPWAPRETRTLPRQHTRDYSFDHEDKYRPESYGSRPPSRGPPSQAKSPVSPKRRPEYAGTSRSTDRLIHGDYDVGSDYSRTPKTPRVPRMWHEPQLEYPLVRPPQGYDDMYGFYDNRIPHSQPNLERHQSLETITSDKSDVWKPLGGKHQAGPYYKSSDAQYWVDSNPGPSVTEVPRMSTYKRTASGGNLVKQGAKSPEVFYSRPSKGLRQHHPVWCRQGDRYRRIVHAILTAFTGATCLVSCPSVKSLPLIWTPCTRIFHLWVPDLQISCRDFGIQQGTCIVAPAVAT